ncbi:hypothetical protein CSHISOI_10738 [Colletotrichum shisoi]|uniref:Aminoglycoside phosphotransferase domain-containing protein n=1 Tax=Colletotrichum shisoi TaxID=2078593 RepID=A0A5Q4BD68_9PEZI|nr:hypothetical protein CSHISOI_10738 [Colletotrichum shisoi]
MPPSLTLSDGDFITYQDAEARDENVLLRAGFSSAFQEFRRELVEQRPSIEALARHHLNLADRDNCVVADESDWIRGAFNMCVPIEVESAGHAKRCIFRCPMPHKLAETRYPGTVDEKMGAEVGAYVWMQEHCQDIRIPRLYGFGFSDGRCFTHEDQRPLYVRIARILRHAVRRCLRYATVLSRYVSNPSASRLPAAHMLLEYIGPDIGHMLSNTWDAEREDIDKRHNLVQGLAHLLVSLARIPQPRIGSFQFNTDCTISLSNRPLTCSLMLWENASMPRTIQRGSTYPCSDPYVMDLIACQDNVFLSDPNAAYDDEDCRGHMAARSLVRLLSHRFVRPEHRYGPFPLQLTDVNRSNIYVDRDWNITGLIDLEWICALPVEALTVPYWLTGQALNQINETEFSKIQQDFIYAVEVEERKRAPIKDGFSLARTMI